jgi:hypothetical protein
MWSLNETVFCNIAPLGLATLQPHCGCLAFQSPPARNLVPRESWKWVNRCWEIFLFRGQYTDYTMKVEPRQEREMDVVAWR